MAEPRNGFVLTVDLPIRKGPQIDTPTESVMSIFDGLAMLVLQYDHDGAVEHIEVWEREFMKKKEVSK